MTDWARQTTDRAATVAPSESFGSYPIIWGDYPVSVWFRKGLTQLKGGRGDSGGSQTVLENHRGNVVNEGFSRNVSIGGIENLSGSFGIPN